MRMKLEVMVLVATMLVAGSYADLFTQTDVAYRFAEGSVNDINWIHNTFTSTGMASSAVGAADLNLIIEGDINSFSEFVDIYADSYFVGRFGNGDGSIYPGPNIIPTLNIPEFDLQQIVSDGEIVWTMSSQGVLDETDNYISYSMSYDAIPEPATIAFVGLFGGGLWILRRYFPSA